MKSRCKSKVYKTIKCSLASEAPKMTLMELQCCGSAKSHKIHNAECPIGRRLGHQRRYQHQNNFKSPRLLPTSRASCRLGTNKDVARTSKMEIPDWRLSPFNSDNFFSHTSVRGKILTVEGIDIFLSLSLYIYNFFRIKII